MNHSDLYLMMTVADREKMRGFIRLFADKGLDTHFLSLGHGTAQEKFQRLLALNETEKMVCLTVVTGRKWLEVKKAMLVRLRIDVPGVGIAFVLPMASICGKRELMFLTDGQDFQKGEEQIMKGTEQELLIVIGKQGYSELIMDAARKAGARGGTVIHARGTGQQKAEQFLGISLASEKDIILIVAPSEQKAAMMQSIVHEAGPGTAAAAIVFSLPVSDTAGITLRPQSEELEEADLPQDAAPAPESTAPAPESN